MRREADCVVLGSGIAGSVCALVLARTGLSVLVVEEKSHPRFALGESTVPTTTLGFDYLARTYGIPELRSISHYPELSELGLAGWPKQAFWFGQHRDGEALQPGRQLLFVSPSLPTGPDVHILRADADAFLVSRLGAYGVEYTDRTSVTGFETGPGGALLRLATPGGETEVRARFVVDASGSASFLARRFGLRDEEPRCRTNSRAIFGHFRGVPFLEDVLPASCPPFGQSRDAATIHHCFEGGWIWVIRFDSGVVSVGLVLDRNVHPDTGLPAEEELGRFLRRFPTVREHLAGAEPVRPPVKTGRLQFTARTIVGERFLLAPHAAGFIDPLFSSGIDLTLAFITRLAPALRRALDEGDLRPERFAPLDRAFQAEMEQVDLMVHGMYQGFGRFELLKQYWRSWVCSSLLQYFTQIGCDPAHPEPLGHYGSMLPGWRGHLERMHEELLAVRNLEEREGARRLQALMDGVAEPFDPGRSNWEIGSDLPCRPRESRPTREWYGEVIRSEPLLAAQVDPERLEGFRRLEEERSLGLQRRYQDSQRNGTPLHRALDFMNAQRAGA